MELDDLRNRLAVVPPGRLIGALGWEVQSLLIASWDHVKGGEAEGTTGYKLTGRIESLEWAPPNLTFVIERHGGTVHGSHLPWVLRRWAEPDPNRKVSNAECSSPQHARLGYRG